MRETGFVNPAPKIQLLGAAELRLSDTAPVRFPTRKALALSAVLARQPGSPVSRGQLADLLWTGKGEKAARANLGQCLASLRKKLFPDAGIVISAEYDHLRLDIADDCVDVSLFEARARANDASLRREALDLYRGPLLSGFSLNSAGFEK